MRKKFFLISIFLSISVLFISFKPFVPKKRIVVLDAGHGGQDSGAKGLKSKEKDVVLSITLKVGNYIEKNMPNVKVIYTRKTDVFIPLNERANIANKNNADLFISIHANANLNTKAYGTETYAMGLHKTSGNLEVAKLENSVIVYEDDYETKYEGFDPNSAESYIIFSLMQNAYLEQSLFLASHIQQQFKNKAKRKNRGVKQAGFLVLWRTTMPSILVETGFISNPKEEIYLNSDEGQSYLASAIYRSVKKYFEDIDKEEKELENKPTSTEKSKKIEKTENNKQNNEKDTIIFRVQILTSSKKIDVKNKLKNYENVFEYKENNLYKYTVGKHENLKNAKKMQKKIKTDYPDAFIVAFRNNKKISLKEALKK